MMPMIPTRCHTRLPLRRTPAVATLCLLRRFFFFFDARLPDCRAAPLHATTLLPLRPPLILIAISPLFDDARYAAAAAEMIYRHAAASAASPPPAAFADFRLIDY
jgi:hypothetical protein